MAYRDDLDAARTRRETLLRELADVQERLADRAELLERERALRAALDDTTRHIDHARARVSLPLLQNVRVASPCHETWDHMSGDDRARHCGRCDKNVFDLSAMTAVEAEALLAASGENLCVRYYRRADGTVMTTDCPDGVRRRRRRRLVVATVVAATTAIGGAASAIHFATRPVTDIGYFADPGRRISPPPEEVKGDYAPEPPPPSSPTPAPPPEPALELIMGTK